MRPKIHFAVFLYLFMAAIAAVKLAGQEPQATKSQIPDGSASAISEWGMSGALWSEAALVRKLAIETMRADVELQPTQREALKKVASDSGALIESMESFGWRRVASQPATNTRLYYTAMIVLLGAEATQVYAVRYGRGIRPEDKSVRVQERIVRSEGVTA